MSKKAVASGYFQATQGRFSRHQSRKVKGNSQQKQQKELIQYIGKNQGQPLQGIYQIQKEHYPQHHKLGIWRKNMSLLTRNHLPTYIKLLQFQENQACFIPSRANINPKKNSKTDFLIEDPQTLKTRLVKMDTFPILFTPQQLAFYQFNLAEFSQVFSFAEFTQDDIKRVFNYLVEQNENSGISDAILWPAVILEGLNYNLDEIQKTISNFMINKNDNFILFQNMLKAVSEISASSISKENQQKSQIVSKQQHKGVGQPQQKQQSIKQNMQMQNEENEQQKIEHKFCIWLLGTGHFIFRDKNIINWHSVSQESIKNIYNGLLGFQLIKQSNLIIDSLNKHRKMREAQLKADEYKSFIYRLGSYKQNQQQYPCIPLRFENVKGIGKRILIRILKSDITQLRWVTTQTTTVNYNLPCLSKKQMNFMYLVQKISPIDIIKRFMYREFLSLAPKEAAEVFQAFYPQFFMSQQQAYHQRCNSCNYIIRNMPFKCCFFCQVFCHEECAVQIRQKTSSAFVEQVFANSEETPWICQKCQACSVCSEAVSDDFLFCSTCFSYAHFQCGKIKGLQQNELKMKHLKINDKYVCQFCLKCKMCGHKLKDNEYLLMESQFYCGQCSDKIKSNNHCHICMKKKQGNNSMKWIQCGSPQCQKWVHEICDPQYINVVKSITASDPYLCPFCRQIQMRKVYSEIIDCIIVFDEAQFFTQPSYLQIPLYSTIISEPMCFNVMKQKSMQGKYDKNAYQKLQADFQLIISNALKFNMPKDPAYIQAKMLKVFGEKTLNKFKPLFNPELTSLITGGTFEEIKKIKLQLHRQINSHYLQILLNYRAQKSFIQVRENKRKPNEIKVQDQLKFRSVEILNNFFKNSTLIFHLKKQKIKIQNLFTMPKNQNERGLWRSIKGDLCYYHNNSQIIFTCNECSESYCCMKQCIRHRICSACGQKQCKCDSYECGCPPLKQKQKKTIQKLILKYSQPMKTYKQILMDLTENYKYCLKCAQQKISTRICNACDGLCSWGYFRCPDCMKVWHKKCYPQLLNVGYVAQTTIPKTHNTQFQPSDSSALNYSANSSLSPINNTFPFAKTNMGNHFYEIPTCSVYYCNECLSNAHPNTYQQALTLTAKSRLVKVSKISRYMRIFIQVYFNEGIRLTPYEIQQLILNNYDQFSIRESLFKQYQLNYTIIERFSDFDFRTNAAIQRSFAQYVNDYIQVKRSNFEPDQNRHNIWLSDNRSYIHKSKKLCAKYFPFHDSILTQFKQPRSHNRYYFATISELREIILQQAYTYKDLYSFEYEKYNNTKNIIQLVEPYAETALKHRKKSNNNMQINQQLESLLSFDSISSYKDYLSSLNYITTMQQSYYKKQHSYRFNLTYFPRSMPFNYKLNPTFKKKNSLEEATREFLLGIYEQSKYCLRKGTTCILKYSNGNKDSKDYWSVLKRWQKGTKQIQIALQKKMGLWFLRIDNKPEKIVHQVQQIWNQINKQYTQGKISSFKQLGEFMGFTIYEPFYKANHFTNFLQTNLVDQMPLLDRMNKITELYQSFKWEQNGIFTKSGPSLSLNPQSDSALVDKVINYEYSINNSKPQYLSKKKKNVDKFPKKLQKKMNSSIGNEGQVNQNIDSQTQIQHSKRGPFITFQDLKKYLIDFSAYPLPIKSQITIKNNPILNQVFIAPSKIHKLGLFSRKFMKKNSIVIQYIGQIVSESIADLREKKFHYGCYLFSILKENHRQNQDKKDIIDATFRGNMARYLNHSCDPNCKAKTEYVNGSPRIIIYTIRDIQQFQEITYDYQFNVDAVQKLQCTCGAKNCQGRLN